MYEILGRYLIKKDRVNNELLEPSDTDMEFDMVK